MTVAETGYERKLQNFAIMRACHIFTTLIRVLLLFLFFFLPQCEIFLPLPGVEDSVGWRRRRRGEGREGEREKEEGEVTLSAQRHLQTT